MPYQNPFALPKTVKPELKRALDYWRDLKRGDNNMPFADDVSLATLRNSQVFLLKVFAPLRFRFEAVGDLHAIDGAPVGRFIDEIASIGTLSYLPAQCCATIEAGEPTFWHFDASGSDKEFSRLLLPAWGAGHIDLLLGVIALG